VKSLLGMKHDEEMKQEGKQEQALSDSQASVTEAENAQKIETKLDSDTRDQLINGLMSGDSPTSKE